MQEMEQEIIILDGMDTHVAMQAKASEENILLE